MLHLIDHMGLGGAQRVICALLSLENNFAHSLRKPENLIDCQQDYSWTDRKTMFNLKCILDTYRIVKKKDIDIIQCHMPIAKAVAIVLKLVPWLDIKLIFHEHGTVFRKNFFYDNFLRTTDLLVYRHITVSDKAKDLIADNGIDRDKIEVLRNFSDTEKFTEDKIKNFNLDKYKYKNETKNFTVGYAGRIVKRKGWRTIIESTEHLEEVDIILTGEGNEVQKIKEKINNKENIYYLGFIDDIRELLNTVDCMVIPSEWDPNPLIFYESQAAEVPVIASNCNSLNEIADDEVNTVLFEPGNSKDLADKIRKIKSNEDLKKQIVNGGREFAEENTKNRFLKRSQNYYKNLNLK